jgi:hypothetical protein
MSADIFCASGESPGILAQFLFVVDAGRLNDGLDPATLAANVVRYAEVTDGKAHGDPHRITGLEYRLLSLRFTSL